jgi:hypothetical protein
MKRYFALALGIAAVFLAARVYVDAKKSQTAGASRLEPPTASATEGLDQQKSPVTPEETATYKKRLGIAPDAEVTGARRQFIADLSLRYNSIPRISTAEIKQAVETQAAIEQEPPEKVAVEVMFAIQRAFMGGNQRENYPLLDIIEQYGQKASPWLLGRLEWQDVGGEFGREVFDLILKIEGKETFRHLVKERALRKTDREAHWQKILDRFGPEP